MRAALIKLFENTVPESYKAGREVLHSILGRDVVQYDKPVFCFLSNQHLTMREDASPFVWETKEKDYTRWAYTPHGIHWYVMHPTYILCIN